MSFLRVRQLGALIFILVSLTVAYHLTFNVFLPASRPPLPGQPDIPAVLLSYFTDPAKLYQLWYNIIFVEGLQGSAVYIRYLFTPFFLLPLLYIAQTIIHRKWPLYRDYSLLYTSWAFIVFTCIWILLTGTVNGIAQAEGWYWAKWPINGTIIEVPGNFDIATHIMANGTFNAVFMSLAFAEWFGLDRLFKSASATLFIHNHITSSLWMCHNKAIICELFDGFAAGIVTFIIAALFEIVEALHPEDYGTWTNLRGNSYGDLACVFLSLTIIMVAYRVFVSRAVRTYE